MESLIFVLDTNVISDRINGVEVVTKKLNAAIESDATVCLCAPVYYEVLRGLIHTGAVRKQQFFEERIMPALDWVELTGRDWRQAARFWADARRKGKQFSDVDLFIAALAARLDAIIISADDDYDALPVRRENWRK